MYVSVFIRCLMLLELRTLNHWPLHTALPLCFHMDEAAYESPPGLQLLHCVRSAWSMWHTLSPLLIMLHGSTRGCLELSSNVHRNSVHPSSYLIVSQFVIHPIYAWSSYLLIREFTGPSYRTLFFWHDCLNESKMALFRGVYFNVPNFIIANNFRNDACVEGSKNVLLDSFSLLEQLRGGIPHSTLPL